jgi:hypothetical protein
MLCGNFTSFEIASVNIPVDEGFGLPSLLCDTNVFVAFFAAPSYSESDNMTLAWAVGFSLARAPSKVPRPPLEYPCQYHPQTQTRHSIECSMNLAYATIKSVRAAFF